MISLPRPCLMLVTEPSPRLPEIVAQAVAGGVNAVQVREKAASMAGFYNLVVLLHAITREDIPLIINANWEAATGFGARSIYLPERSVPLGVVRHRIGQDALIGKSIHSIANAQKAVIEGADYLIAGTIFASQSHPEIAPTGLDFLREVCAAVSIPVLAIGGVTPENAGDCLCAGAAGIAVLSPIMRAADPKAAAQAYRAALDGAWEPTPLA